SNPNDYRCEAQDIEFSSFDNDLIYYSGLFPKSSEEIDPDGVFKFTMSNNKTELIELNVRYAGGIFSLFDNENRIFVTSGNSVSIINQGLQIRELKAVVNFEYPFVFKVLYSNNYNLFIGNSNVNIGGVMFDSQSNIENNIESEIRISPNPTNGYVNINLNCTEPVINYIINNTNGILLKKSAIENQVNSLQFDFTPYPSGVYFLTISCNKQTKTYKIIKEG
ncbi:MAG: hypothetical protein CVV25_12870, partial [Ignavibacteriae bacterium HGW-Ignavibacteriae-4]